MPFTGDEHYGWRVAAHTHNQRASNGSGDSVDLVVIELVKGQRHIESVGQHGIGPEIVLGRALSAALLDDIREAIERNSADLSTLVDLYRRHELHRELNENGWIAKRIGTVFQATTIGTGAGG